MGFDPPCGPCFFEASSGLICWNCEMSEVNVYLVHLDSARLPHNALTDWLDSAERTRCAAYGREILRRRFVAAHAALRLILGRVLGRHPAEIIFRRNAWGRPEMPEGPAFNLSHAGPQALIAVSGQQAIGVDIELLERKMSREVYDAVTSAEEHQDRADAGDRLRLWVRKEAVLKALGLGLSFAPQAVTVGAHAADYKRWKLRPAS
jgi:4'-phosphopantetheinyl transferase